MQPATHRARLELLWEFVKRSVARSYKGSRLGVAWTVLSPLLLLAVYTVVFAYFLRLGSGGREGGPAYALMIFSGLVPFRVLSTSMSRAPGCIREHSILVKRVVFPVEVLPASVALAALAEGLFSLGVLLVMTLVVEHALPWTVLLAPLVLAVLLVFSTALAYWLAAAGTLVRDVGALIPPLTRALMFLTPIVYDIGILPERLQRLQMFNPVAIIVLSHRRVVLRGEPPMWGPLAALAAGSLVLLAAGRWWFEGQRRFFPEVL